MWEIAGHGLDSNFSVSKEQFLIVSEEEMQNLKWEEIYMGKASVTEEVLSYIEDHLGQDLSLEEIARELNYSKYYVARAFKENTGMTLHKYIQGRRLSEAARKLAQTEQPIIEVAFDAGYGSQQAFTQAFRQEYLCTPREYRRIGRFVPRQSRLTDRFPSSYLGSATGKPVVFLRNMMEPCMSRKCVSQVCFPLERGIAA